MSSFEDLDPEKREAELRKIDSISVTVTLVLIPILIGSYWFYYSSESIPEPIQESYYYGGSISSLEISSDGRYIAMSDESITADSSAIIWDHVSDTKLPDPAEGVQQDRLTYRIGQSPISTRLKKLDDGESYGTTDVTFSPDGKYLFIGSSKRDSSFDSYEVSTLSVYDLVSLESPRRHTFQGNGILDIAISPDNTLYASSARMDKDNEECTIYLWDIDTGNTVKTIKTNDYEAKSLTFTPDGQYLVASFSNTVSRDRIVFFDVESGTIERAIYESATSELQFSADGKIFAGICDHYPSVWDTESGKRINKFEYSLHHVEDISLSPDGRYLLGNDEHDLIAWDVSNGKTVMQLLSQNIEQCQFSKDGEFIVVSKEVYVKPTSVEYKENVASIPYSSSYSKYEWEVYESDNIAEIYDAQDLLEGNFVHKSFLAFTLQFIGYGMIGSIAILIIISHLKKKEINR